LNEFENIKLDMMKKLLTVLAVLMLFVACKNGEQKTTDQADVKKEVNVVHMVDLDDFHTEAGKYVNQQIVTKGIVDHVCKHGGKRILLVTDESDVHIDSETRFDEDLTGSEIEVTGIVLEERIDEASCLQMEEDNINSHKSGELDDDQLARKNEHIAFYRDSMKVAGVDHLSFYSLEYVSHKEIK
jgi:PBP1b-binding outer membrane lipoprotein LpoB